MQFKLTQPIKRTHTLQVRMTEADYQTLYTLAESAGKTVSDLVREMLQQADMSKYTQEQV